jgi:hypothetical protein
LPGIATRVVRSFRLAVVFEPQPYTVVLNEAQGFSFKQFMVGSPVAVLQLDT